jgi:serine phosphatase RsbU (regulator of sigma subunit)
VIESHFTSPRGIVDITERRVVYANAGHLPPLVVRKNGTVELLEATGAALGSRRERHETARREQVE